MKASEAIFVVASLLIIAVVLFGFRCTAQRECEERGGTVRKVHSTRDPLAWACDEKGAGR